MVPCPDTLWARPGSPGTAGTAGTLLLVAYDFNQEAKVTDICE